MNKQLTTVLSKTGITVTEPVIERIGPFTIAHIKDSKDHIGYGVARLSGIDHDNPEIGANIAKSRAEKALFRKLNHKVLQHVYMG